MKQTISSVTYFGQEGRENLDECLRLSFEAAVAHGLDKIVIFTGVGEGLQIALDNFLATPEFAHIRIIGVTFPQGHFSPDQANRVFSHEASEAFRKRGVSVLRAHLPFESISTQYRHHGVLAQDLSIVGNALNMFCGGMSLCIQAVLVACDAGEIEVGEHVIVLTSDTALIVRAAPTRKLLTDLLVRQIVCKPAFLTISKAEKLLDAPDVIDAEAPSELENPSTKHLEASSDTP